MPARISDRLARAAPHGHRLAAHEVRRIDHQQIRLARGLSSSASHEPWSSSMSPGGQRHASRRARASPALRPPGPPGPRCRAPCPGTPRRPMSAERGGTSTSASPDVRVEQRRSHRSSGVVRPRARPGAQVAGERGDRVRRPRLTSTSSPASQRRVRRTVAAAPDAHQRESRIERPDRSACDGPPTRATRPGPAAGPRSRSSRYSSTSVRACWLGRAA